MISLQSCVSPAHTMGLYSADRIISCIITVLAYIDCLISYMALRLYQQSEHCGCKGNIFIIYKKTAGNDVIKEEKLKGIAEP